jgi:hypothetical protein
MSTDTDAPQPMTQLDYAEKVLEDRDTGTQSAAALLSGLGAGLGVLSLWFAPMVLGFIAIGCAILGLALMGDRDRFGRIAMTIAVTGWLVGSIIAVLLSRSPISLNLT